MLENLLSNAVKYGRDGGHIEVRLKKDNGIVLSVKDDGIGIKEEDLPKIWGRFYRADESRSRESGFGRSLARQPDSGAPRRKSLRILRLRRGEASSP